ncbi:class I SAM-dependent DNA methyltransferase [Streptomyces sp. NPDC021212]|uniref:class I SAM-dependent DNA methyltransferase n=1 Tax=Streptomyces sp. NPDC021212 TaxID=3365118 RepID=UPI0037BB38E0
MANGFAHGNGMRREERWTGKDIADQLRKFYNEKTSTRAITRLQFAEHFGYLLFLKLDHERSQRVGRFARKPVAPVDAWPNLVMLSGDALHEKLEALMDELGNPAPAERPDRQTASAVFRDAQPWGLNRMAELTKLIVEEIAPYHWSSVPQAELGDAFSRMLRECRDDIDLKIETGQTLTPQPVLSAITKVLGVHSGDTVIDPACGTGSTLVAAYNLMLSQGGHLPPSALAGADLDAQMCRLATMNILLHTGRPFSDPAPVQLADTLTRRGTPVMRADLVVAPTVAICNPPFKSSGVQPDADMRDDFWAYGDFPTNFLQHLAITLPQGARAAVFVPDGVLFGGGAAATVREALLKNCDVHTLLRLPSGLFHRKGVQSNILFFTKSAPKPSGEPATQSLWVYDARSGIHHTDTGNPVAEDDFDEFLSVCLPEGGFAARDESVSKRFRRYPVEELLARPMANLHLMAHIAPEIDDLGDPKDVALQVAEHLEEAARHFREVSQTLP